MSQSLASAGVRIFNLSVKETTNAAGASFEILDGGQPTANVILEYTLVANESVRDFFGEKGIRVENGVYLNVISGSIKGNVNSATEVDYQDHCNRMAVVKIQPTAGM